MSGQDTMTEVKNIIDAGAAIGKPVVLNNGAAYAIIPDGYMIEDLETFSTTPMRKRGIVSFDDINSLISYTSLHKEKGTAIFFDISNKKIITIINHHNDAGPGWGDHRAIYSFTPTPAWSRWTAKNDTPMNQLDFADFIEANIEDISDPAGADIMDMVSALRVRQKAEFHSVIDTATGEKSIQYSEETRGESVKGNLDFKGRFTLGIAPFRGGEKYAVPCRLRFSIHSDRKLRIFFQIINPEVIEEAAMDAMSDTIRSQAEIWGCPVYLGFAD